MFLMLLTGSAVSSLAIAHPADGKVVGFTVGQAIAGKSAFDAQCASCHGADLGGAGPAVSLRGSGFLQSWSNRSAGEFFAAIRRMPPGQPDAIDATTAASIFAYILQANGIFAGAQLLPPVEAELQKLSLPAPGSAPAGASTHRAVVIPPRASSRLDSLTPVPADLLKAPPQSDWLQWRRTYDAFGYSPLRQIDRKRIGDLQLAWSWSLPRGDNMMAPIVHDGVLFAYSHGDVVEALDATTGDLLWRYERALEGGATFHGKKGVAISGSTVLVPTSDMHVLALDARSGSVVWDHAIDTGGQVDFQIKSAPLVAAGRVIIGVNGFTTRGGNFIVALDTATGAEVWRFYTVAQPGEPGDDTWNGQPGPMRSGGSVWTGGSYDPELNLVFFGAAPTYNPMPLRVANPGFSTEALYTNSTLALNAETGALVWHFQHQANDQFDHDWAFEHQIVELAVGGVRQKLVLTGGKAAIFEAMDAATGAYAFHIDLGMQNVFASIDPRTGAKTMNPAAIPGPREILKRGGLPGICPDLLGARNLMATAFDPVAGMLFVPLTDTCIHPFPNGERWQKKPEPASAGKYGLVQAVDLKSRQVRWTAREKAPPISGALATAGGLIFLGDADRWFRAYDSASGKVLWSTRLDNPPASYPISYEVDGKQYVAVATNQGFVHVQAMQQAARITPSPNNGATLWVFMLREK